MPTAKAHFIYCKSWLDGMMGMMVDSGIMRRVEGGVFEELPHEMVSLGMVSWIYSRHKRLGHPVIEPESHLAAALADHTDFNDMISSELPEMPHDCLWITFPPGFDIFLDEVLKPESLRVSGAYVMSAHDEGSLVVYLWAPPKHGREIGDDRFSYMSIWPGVDLDERLGKKWTDGEVVDGQIARMQKSLTDKEKDDWKRALRMILGTLLYMQCDGSIIDIVTSEDREEGFRKRHGRKRNLNKGLAGRERKALDAYGHSDIIYVGSGWADTREGQAYSRGRELEAADNPESRRRHWVRGHFRNQAHGAGYMLRKRIWISPHQRGDDTLNKSEVTYRVRS